MIGATLQRVDLVAIFAANLRAAMSEHELTQVLLAQKLGFSVSYVSMLARRERAPPLETVEAVAEALQKDPRWFLTERATTLAWAHRRPARKRRFTPPATPPVVRGSGSQARFARNVRTLRRLRGWTELDLAPRVGLGPTQLVRVEAGRSSVSLAVLDRFARTLGVAPAYLLQDLAPSRSRP